MNLIFLCLNIKFSHQSLSLTSYSYSILIIVLTCIREKPTTEVSMKYKECLRKSYLKLYFKLVFNADIRFVQNVEKNELAKEGNIIPNFCHQKFTSYQ